MKKALDALLASIGMFTRIPIPYHPMLPDSRSLLIAYPVVGAAVGLLWFGLYHVLAYLGTGALMGAALLTIFPWLITGFMHLDGFMDIMDALLASRDMEKRLRILKDPNSGAFSVCAFGCLLAVTFAAMAELYPWVNPRLLLLLPVFSRGMGALSLALSPPIEASAMGRAFGEGLGLSAKLWFALYMLASIVGIAYIAGSSYPLLAPVLGLLAYRWAVRGLGGTSGDVAGFVLVVSEAAVLCILGLV